MASIADALKQSIADALEGANLAVTEAKRDRMDPFKDLQSQLKVFAALENARRDLEDALAAVKAEISAMAEPLLEQFCLEGIQHQRVDGLTIYVRTDTVVNKRPAKDGVTTEMVCDALEKCGLGDLVGESYSGAALKSRLLEIIEKRKEELAEAEKEVPENPNELLPEELKNLVNVMKISRLATRK